MLVGSTDGGGMYSLEQQSLVSDDFPEITRNDFMFYDLLFMHRITKSR